MSEPSPHLGVPDAEEFSALLETWRADIRRAIELIQSDQLIMATVKLTEVSCAIRAADDACADAWDAPRSVSPSEEQS